MPFLTFSCKFYIVPNIAIEVIRLPLIEELWVFKQIIKAICILNVSPFLDLNNYFSLPSKKLQEHLSKVYIV